MGDCAGAALDPQGTADGLPYADTVTKSAVDSVLAQNRDRLVTQYGATDLSVVGMMSNAITTRRWTNDDHAPDDLRHRRHTRVRDLVPKRARVLRRCPAHLSHAYRGYSGVSDHRLPSRVSGISGVRPNVHQGSRERCA